MRRGLRRLILTIALVAAIAAAATLANLALLSSTQDSSDPVGRLSPRAVFSPAGASSQEGSGKAENPKLENGLDD